MGTFGFRHTNQLQTVAILELHSKAAGIRYLDTSIVQSEVPAGSFLRRSARDMDPNNAGFSLTG